MGRHDIRLNDPELAEKLNSFLSAPGSRIEHIEAGGQSYWVKKGEELSLRWRLQKGDPHKAIRADIEGHHALADAGVPVPEIIAEGDDFIVTDDCGPTLARSLKRQSGSETERIRAFSSAGRELAGLHEKGLSHGRPAIKDICWNGRSVAFLDFERFSPRRNTMRGHMQDLIIMIHSCYATTPVDSTEARAAAIAYRENDQLGVWKLAETWCRSIRWIDPITKPLQWGNRVGAREFKAIPLTLKAFGVSR